MQLPDRERYAIKGKWDQGGGVPLDALHNVVNPQDPGSVRKHIKDLQAQGVSPEKIKERLAAQGVDPSKYSDAIVGSAGSLKQHAKDLRDQVILVSRLRIGLLPKDLTQLRLMLLLPEKRVVLVSTPRIFVKRVLV